ncbi:MAG: glycosyltransferase [Bacteroidia bacterium]|jgi:glycosyltransferase involved in cell wall biosynthesis|nr:glycosyltransferase [Bacteroidia bacterium]
MNKARESVSVCMATYNGEKHILKQINSILQQFNPKDELIIVDDASNDNTIQVIKNISDNRIRLHVNDANKGVTKTFERALKLVQNNIVFLSDQDDEWMNNKIDFCVNILADRSYMAVNHDAVIVDENEQVVCASNNTFYKSRQGFVKNLISTSYKGCCMAFRKELINIAIPFPNNIGPAHDVWLGLILDFCSFKVNFSYDILMKHYRHSNNASLFNKRRKLTVILKNRLVLVWQLIIFVFTHNLLAIKLANIKKKNNSV